MEITPERKEKIIAISKTILEYAELLDKSTFDSMDDSPIIDKIIIACLKHKHASGVPPQEALSIIQKLLK